MKKKFSANTEGCLMHRNTFLCETSGLQSLHCDCVYSKHASRLFKLKEGRGEIIVILKVLVINQQHAQQVDLNLRVKMTQNSLFKSVMIVTYSVKLMHRKEIDRELL